ncbi:GDSL esterase/lipase At1g29670-like [Ricinus communis]|uniref:GDSL esterase/lipase At1g29670-like n=1 Tax=Ricinus communis TaxID=3988 RepID=UPI000D699E27|nr:GDSL esterase/lipase At1g29670-like [Ricinus communis]|eukprot:XP_015576672.2 GDSL esterase/lipase At1g29670-like [Ricinus communis]
MARPTKVHISLAMFLVIIACLKQYSVNGEPKVPCYFIFGDSLVDSGNNNNLATTAKVNYPPYGIDFPDGPTGRFCNGRTTADVIGELLGFENFIPPFLSANGTEILKGVNYASGSAGIRTETGKQLGVNVDLSTQLQNHQVTISHIIDILGSKDSATQHLNKCFYSFVIGNNDYINNYFLPQFYNTSIQYTPEQYAEVLIEEYSQRIMKLYNSGARKVALTGIGPIGCTPGAVNSYDTNGSLCVDSMNQAANFFNNRLQLLVDELNSNLTDAKFIYLNTYGIVSEYAASPGFDIKINGCCEVNEFGLCIPYDDPCEFRNLHLFWDAFHPSEIANKISAGISYLSLKKIFEVYEPADTLVKTS